MKLRFACVLTRRRTADPRSAIGAARFSMFSMATPGRTHPTSLSAARQLQPRRSAISIHGDDGTASASLDLHARLAQQLESCRAQRSTATTPCCRPIRSLAPGRRRRHLVYPGPVDRALECDHAQARSRGCRAIEIPALSNWHGSCARRTPTTWNIVQAVLAMFTQQPFFYTLTPPKLADDSVDEFLFDTETRILRPLRLGFRSIGARRGHTGAGGHRISRRDAESLWGLLDIAAKRRACLDGSVDRGTGLGAHRSHGGDRTAGASSAD